MINDIRVLSDTVRAEHDRVMAMPPIEYRGYLIKPVSHVRQPCCVGGKVLYWGFNIVYASGRYEGCNAAPGATWARTVGGAKTMIDVMHEAGEEPGYRDTLAMSRADAEAHLAAQRAWSERFWRLLRERD